MRMEKNEYTLTKEILDSVRHIDGFPIGEDEDIIALSDPPYYTAYPNPSIADFIKQHGKLYDPDNDNYQHEPFTLDVSEGKNDPIYNIHSYPTKVPYKAIMNYIFHYTDPGDIVFDGFAGTGMTGVAANKCSIKDSINSKSLHGKRYCILSELSPIAAFISGILNTKHNIKKFKDIYIKILSSLNEELGWMYETNHVIDGKIIYQYYVDKNKKPIKGKIIYIVWSDVFICPNCGAELVYWDINEDDKKEMNCTFCEADINIRSLERLSEAYFDSSLNKIVKRVKQKPVLISYCLEGSGKNKRYYKIPDEDDINLINKIEEMAISYWHPVDEVPDGFNTSQPKKSHFIDYVHQFYTKRNYWFLSSFYNKIMEFKDIHDLLLFWFTSSHSRLHRLNRYMPKHKRHVGPLSGTLYISPLQAEISPFYFVEEKAKKLSKLNFYIDTTIISTQSTTDLSNFPENSVDYIFTDPPFGGNLMYSELNFLLESWLKVFTNNQKEAIINNVQKKELVDYQQLMVDCFREMYRVLKPNRWITVEFHNSNNSVWTAIQEALSRAGFVIADVRTLDKRKGTTKQLSYVSKAVKQDLIISSYKPKINVEEIVRLKEGSLEGVWRFVDEHLDNLPIFIEKNSVAEIIVERQNFLLYDRMVAFHVQRGLMVPVSSADFYRGLKERYAEREGMYFTFTQVHKYDKERLKHPTLEQATLFVQDEKSAIQWLRRELEEQRMTYQDIQPRFLKSLFKYKHESLPELIDILEENFLQDENDRWYVPDPDVQSDLEKIREKGLLREYYSYFEQKGKLSVFRSESIRVGFNHSWGNGDYKEIIQIAEKIPARVLNEDHTLLMFYDNALSRIE